MTPNEQAQTLCHDPHFMRLSSAVQRWIRSQKPPWTYLHEIQRIVVPKLLDSFQNGFVENVESDRDFIVAAPTATGKTEAVFLPLASLASASGGRGNGVLPAEIRPEESLAATGASVLYICPLTALIDQQAKRLRGLFPEETHPVTPWHGASNRTAKRRFREEPKGVLIITPESLESQFVNRLTTQTEFEREYGALSCVVIDELHAFFDSPRGYQLVSQLARLESALDRRVTRIALSATFDPLAEASIQRFLRPEAPESVEFLRDQKTERNLEFRVDCFTGNDDDDEACDHQIARQIVEDFSFLAKTRRKNKQKGLVFVNSRQQSERFSHELSELAEVSGGGLAFRPHHGSLSTHEKNAAIEAINDPALPAILVCTTTLELGIDIGSIVQVGQIDPGATVASLQQRLGRSGRKHGQLARLHVYVREAEAGDDAGALDALHLPTFQALAQIHLVEQGAFEEPDPRPAHLSTLIQQILSHTRQRGSITEAEAREVMVHHGPFRALHEENDPDGHLALLFARLEAAGLLERRFLGGDRYYLSADALPLLRGIHFYAAFQTRTEFSVYGPDGLLGKIPLGTTYKVGDQIIFARRRWRITSLNRSNLTIRVEATSAGEAPIFPGDPITPSAEVVKTMHDLYRGMIDPEAGKLQLAASARRFYTSGLDAFARRGLDRTRVLPEGNGVLLFPWLDARGQTSLLLALRYWGLSAIPAKLAIYVRSATLDEVVEVLDRLTRAPAGDTEPPAVPPGPEAARNADSLAIDKHDRLLSPYLQRWNFATFRLDMDAVPRTAQELLDASGT